MSYLILFISLFNFLFINVSADTYQSNNNLTENSYSNSLIDMANNQIPNFLNKNYIIIQYDYDYILLCSDNYSINNNIITMQNSSIIKATRVSSGYNYYYDYNFINEDSSNIHVNNLVISNIPINKSISSKRFADYRHYLTFNNLGIFILGLCFALFLTKERRYV